MNKYILNILVLFTISGYAQIANYNQFPKMKPHHILDDKLDNISFAFSMRVLESDYNGPIVRLRKTVILLGVVVQEEEDFGWGDNDIVDIEAINAWRGTSEVFVRTWYDQSGLGRNAEQALTVSQPRFYPDASTPYFQGDGINDHLTIDTPNGIQNLTNNGNEGTVIGIMRATNKAQHTFGVLINTNRWSTHINWNDQNLYFDPGVCCNNPRNFNNSANLNVWEIYSFIRTSTNVIARSGAIQRFNGTHTTGRCTLTEDFAIGWATGNQLTNHATTSFNELIMYNTNINTVQVQDIELNSITFWGI
ncbi:hypothetical protein [Tenacibaculum bernardetii]|uniref:hypothetical protein n=1 Tax=Tenacibaculum bernardetii TaxID=3021375 RepID=UPI0023B0CA83|nr:hypothetical protein [Tenacibaculum bernardetii]